MSEEDRSRIVDPIHESFRFSRGDVQMFGSKLVDDLHRLVLVSGQHECSEGLQALPREAAARQRLQLFLDGLCSFIEQRSMCRGLVPR